MFGFICEEGMSYVEERIDILLVWEVIFCSLEYFLESKSGLKKGKEMFLESWLYDLSEIYWGNYCVWVFKCVGKFYDYY